MNFSKIIWIVCLKIALTFSLFIFGSKSFSAITFESDGVTGVSYFDPVAKQIYGGVAGACSSPSPSSTCSTCTDSAGPLKACNQTSIHGNLTITIKIKSDKNLASPASFMTLKVQGAQGTGSEVEIDKQPGKAAGELYTFTTTWGVLCERIVAAGATPGLNADCSITSPFTTDVFSSNGSFSFFEGDTKTNVPVIYHGVDPVGYTPTFSQSYTGIPIPVVGSQVGLYLYTFKAGDQKLVLQGEPAPTIVTTMPTNTSEFFGVALIIDEQTSTPATPVDTTNFANGKFPITILEYKTTTTGTSGSTSNNTSFSDNYITGLTNGKTYCVVAGQMNKAKNIIRATLINLDPTKACDTPAEVIGILDDKKCFISTAAFGSDMSDEVKVLRQFRGDYLMKFQLGRVFVRNYYKFSPPIADFISTSEVLKLVTRALLYPFVAFAWMCLNFGFWPTALVTFFLFIFLFDLRRSFTKKVYIV